MDRDKYRESRAAEIPEFYHPWLHLSCTVGIGLVCAILCLLKVRNPTFVELLTLPALFVLANGAEYRAHKSLLHHRIWPFGKLYDQHTPRHHAMFDYHHMEIRSPKELNLVLIPSSGVLTIVLVTLPFAYAFSHFFSPNSGWLLLVGSGIYVVGYELTHLSYHLPPESLIGSMKLVRILREHHRRHHHPRLMQKWNFNVTIPLFDWIKGTIAPTEVLVQANAVADPEKPGFDLLRKDVTSS